MIAFTHRTAAAHVIVSAYRTATARERSLPYIAALVLACAALAQPDAATTARKALDYLLSEKYTELSALAAPSAKQTLTPQFLRDRPGAEVRSFGRLGTIGAPVTAKDGRNTLVSFPVRFERVTVNVQFTLNESAQIAGLFFRPGNAPLPAVWHRPSYSSPEAFRAREVVVGEDPWKLGGTLAHPRRQTAVSRSSAGARPWPQRPRRDHLCEQSIR